VKTDIKPNTLRPRWSKVRSDLWDDKTRTSLVIASIAVGVFAIGMIITAFVILKQDINRSYAAVNPPNIEVFTDPFYEDFVRVIEKVPGVDDVEGRHLIGVRARREVENWQDLTLVGVASAAGKINLLDPIEGLAYPGKNEVVISQSLMFVTGFNVGDIIEIELPDGSNHDLAVVGLAFDQTISKPDPNNSNNAYVTLDTLRSLGVESYFNQLYITVDGDGSDADFIASVAASIDDKVERSQREVYRTDESLSSEHPMADTILAVIGVLGALGGLVTILSSSLIVNTLNALLTQQLRQIGIMKLVGGRSYQILGMYLTLIIAYGLIALVLAVPLGAVAGYTLAWFITNMMGAVIQGFRIVPAAVIAQTLIAILVPLGAGFFPVHSGAKTNVRRAISNDRPGSQAAKSNIFNLNTGWMRWISRPILLSFRNTFRQRGRLLLTIFTLTVSGAVFIAVFNVRDSMTNLMDQLMQHFLGDVTVSFSQPYRVGQVERTLLAIPGIEGVEGWGGAAGEVLDENDDVVSNVSIIAPPQDTQLLTPDFVAGRWLLPGEKKAFVVSDTIYKFYPNLEPGDKIIIKLPGQREEEWSVVGVFRFVDMFGDLMAYANFEFIADKMNIPNQATSYRVITTHHDDASQQALTGRIDRYLSDRDYAVQGVQSGYLMRGKAVQAVNIIVIFLLIMAILTAFVGSIGLTGTMSINVLERTREIGVMRTIGAVDRVIMQSVIIEALVIGLITWILAIGLSFPISSLLLTIVGEAMAGSVITLSFTPLGILLWLVVIIVLSIFASIIPARNAARLTINEVLAYE
jgi:putative ABC transport system permease protein